MNCTGVADNDANHINVIANGLGHYSPQRESIYSHQEIDWLVLVVARSEYALNLGLHMVYDDYWKMSIGKSLVIPTPVA